MSVDFKIGFSTSGSWISNVIEFFTGGDCSHAFLLVEGDPVYGDMVLEAIGTGWSMRTKENFLSGTTRIVRLVDPPVPLGLAFRTSLGWLGERYAYVGVVGMIWVAVGRWLKRKWRNPLRSSRSMFCSEAIVYLLQSAGWPPAKGLDPESVDPYALEQLLLGAGGRAN